jgi:hypothetical protein
MSSARGRAARLVRRALLVALSALPYVISGQALAQERPSEDDMFGGTPAPAPPGDQTTPAPAEATPPAAAQAAPPSPSSGGRDAQILGSAPPPMFTDEAAPDDPLTIGGQLYWRALVSGVEEQDLGDYAFSTPALLDVFLDVRPNERVRGFVLTRLQYDPSVVPGSAPTGSLGAGAEAGGVQGSQELSSLFAPPTRGPRLVLDQLWLRFDIDHVVFVTAGTQHVRWGTGRFWAPTDYLHLSRRDPLAVFDARTGTTMLKVHVPIESKAWNFYGYVVTEDEESSSSVERIAGAARAEFVLGPAELGLGVFARRHEQARYAADLSIGVGDFDLYSELALREAGEVDRVRFAQGVEAPPLGEAPSWQTPAQTVLAELTNAVDAFYPRYRKHGLTPQVVAGLTYAQRYNDNDTWSLGAEYFYNGLGYGSAVAYPGLVLPHTTPLRDPASFFYLGKVYGGVFLNLPSPYSLDNHTFTLSTLGNLSDKSFITRLDYGLILLTHLRFEAFAAARYGHINGEFRFGADDLTFGGYDFSRSPALLDLGVALRVDI